MPTLKCMLCNKTITRGKFCNPCSFRILNEKNKIRSGGKRRRKRVFRRDQGICQICGVDTGQHHQGIWQMDHIVPLASGGSHDASNLRTLCIPYHDQITKQFRKSLNHPSNHDSDLTKRAIQRIKEKDLS